MAQSVDLPRPLPPYMSVYFLYSPPRIPAYLNFPTFLILVIFLMNIFGRAHPVSRERYTIRMFGKETSTSGSVVQWRRMKLDTSKNLEFWRAWP